MSSRNNDDVWAGRGDRAYNVFTDHPVVVTLVGLIAIALVVGVVGLAGGWFSGTAHLTSFSHTSEQTTAVLDDWTQLQAEAGNACSVKDAASTANDPTFVEDPAFAYEAKYRATKADFDRRMNNFFEAYVTKKIPIPGSIHSLPRLAPTLKAMERQVC